MILITGGSGFIGANFIINSFKRNDDPIVNLDKLTYAANQENLRKFEAKKNYFFEKGSIDDFSLAICLCLKNTNQG